MKRNKGLKRSSKWNKKPLDKGATAKKYTDKRKESHSEQWHRIKKEVLADFDRLGITRCEECGSMINLSLAHRMKRRRIYQLRDPELIEQELHIVALLCMSGTSKGCHDKVERMSHEQMFDAITQIILKRPNVYSLPPKPDFIEGYALEQLQRWGAKIVFDNLAKTAREASITLNKPKEREPYSWMDDEDREKL